MVKMSSVAVSAGTSQSDAEVVRGVLDAHPTVRFICLDVANGYSEAFVNAVRRMREEHATTTILAGNVVTCEMTEELLLSGADVDKVGIGPGSVCTTRRQTGVGYVVVTSLYDYCVTTTHCVTTV